MEEKEVDLRDLIQEYLPAPPGRIIIIGDEAAEPYSAPLRSAGYQLICCSSLEELNGVSAVRSKRLLGQYRPIVEGEEECGPLPTPFNAILLLKFSCHDAPMLPLFGSFRNMLGERGRVLICNVATYNPVRYERQGIQLHFVTALYESGFAIRVKEWIRIKRSGDDQEQEQRRCHFIVAQKDRVVVRDYKKGDEAEILSVFNEVFRVNRTVEHWYWKFRDNPFGAYRIAEAYAEDGRLAGHYSGYPVPFHAGFIGGQVFICYQIGDIMTRPSFRQVGLANTSVLGRITDYFHHRFCLGRVPFMYGFITGSHKRFGERFLGYTYLSKVPYYRGSISEFHVSPKERVSLLFSGFSVKRVDEITTEFDGFWEEVSVGYGLLVKRNASYLKWRYLDCPDHVHALFALRRFGRLVGWGAFSRRGDTLIWGDALFQKISDAQPVKYLIHQVISGHFPKVTRVEGWFSNVPLWWTQLLHDAGLHATDEPNGLVSGVTIFDESFSLEDIRKNFYYTMGDSDLF